MVSGDCAWLNRRQSAFATIILRTFATIHAPVGEMIAYTHIGHKTMDGEEPFKVLFFHLCIGVCMFVFGT